MTSDRVQRHTVQNHYLLVLILSLVFPFALQAEEGFVPLFDGETLDGWEGDFDIWSAQDGKIVGKSTDDGLAENKFLCTTICRNHPPTTRP